MNTLAVILVVSSAIMHASWNYLIKQAKQKEEFFLHVLIYTLILTSPLAIFFLLTGPTITTTGWLYILSSGIIHFIYYIVLLRSYHHGDLSHVYPIIRSAPAFVMIVAVVLFNDTITFIGALGVLITTIGVYIINYKRSEGGKPILPWYKDIVTVYAGITLILVVIFSFVDKFGVQHVHPVVFGNMFVAIAVTLFVLFVKSSQPKKRFHLGKFNKKAGLAALLLMPSYYLILIAFTFENISYVIGLRQIGIVFAVLMGSHLLQEKHKLIRLAGGIIIFAGAYLIAIA